MQKTSDCQSLWDVSFRCLRVSPPPFPPPFFIAMGEQVKILEVCKLRCFGTNVAMIIKGPGVMVRYTKHSHFLKHMFLCCFLF